MYGWTAAIRGMRNPKNSWENNDSYYTYVVDDITGQMAPFEFYVGPKDLALMVQLAHAGTDHGKFLRMINVTADIIAPLYWWKEFETYKVGTVANSCSTMHKIHDKEFSLGDFSHEHLQIFGYRALEQTINILNVAREKFLDTGDKEYWYQMIQLLPSSYNQKRTVQLNYAVLQNQVKAREHHKLDEWHTYCDWAKELPYFSEICL